MDGTRKFPSVYKGRILDRGSQRNRIRLSEIEFDMESENNYKDDSGYISYVQVGKPKQGRRTQPEESGKTRRKNQEGVRRFRPRSQSDDD